MRWKFQTFACAVGDTKTGGVRRSPQLGGKGETGHKNPALRGTLAIVLKALSGFSVLTLYCLLNQCLSVNEIRNVWDFRLLD